MEEILILLIAIQRTAKDIHYHAKGANFWGDHLLADRIYDGLEDLMDEIQENYFMGSELNAPHQKQLYQKASEKMSDNEDVSVLFSHERDLIYECIAKIESLPKDEISSGDSDLLGRICSDLMKKNGFIFSRLK